MIGWGITEKRGLLFMLFFFYIIVMVIHHQLSANKQPDRYNSGVRAHFFCPQSKNVLAYS